jgi:hypothetical protein
MADETGSGTIDPAMPPPAHRSGEWPDLRELINNAVTQAVKQAMDGDSGITKGTDAADAATGREDMKRLVAELRAAMISSVGDVRQSLLDRLTETNTSLQSMVREEVGSLRTSVEGSLREIKDALHQGDTTFAVMDTKMKAMQAEVDRFRDTPSTGMRAAPVRPRDDTTGSHRKEEKSKGDTTSYTPIIATALITAMATSLGTWGMDLLGRGAKEAVKDAVKDERAAPKPPAPLLPAPNHSSSDPDAP